jgi:hypothetical protein
MFEKLRGKRDELKRLQLDAAVLEAEYAEVKGRRDNQAKIAAEMHSRAVSVSTWALIKVAQQCN